MDPLGSVNPKLFTLPPESARQLGDNGPNCASLMFGVGQDCGAIETYSADMKLDMLIKARIGRSKGNRSGDQTPASNTSYSSRVALGPSVSSQLGQSVRHLNKVSGLENGTYPERTSKVKVHINGATLTKASLAIVVCGFFLYCWSLKAMLQTPKRLCTASRPSRCEG